MLSNKTPESITIRIFSRIEIDRPKESRSHSRLLFKSSIAAKSREASETGRRREKRNRKRPSGSLISLTSRSSHPEYVLLWRSRSTHRFSSRRDAPIRERLLELVRSRALPIGADRSRRKPGGAFVSAWKGLSSGQMPLHGSSRARFHGKHARTIEEFEGGSASNPQLRVSCLYLLLFFFARDSRLARGSNSFLPRVRVCEIHLAKLIICLITLKIFSEVCVRVSWYVYPLRNSNLVQKYST